MFGLLHLEGRRTSSEDAASGTSAHQEECTVHGPGLLADCFMEYCTAESSVVPRDNLVLVSHREKRREGERYASDLHLMRLELRLGGPIPQCKELLSLPVVIISDSNYFIFA